MRTRFTTGVTASLCFLLTLAIYLSAFRILLRGARAQAQDSPSSTVLHNAEQSRQGPHSPKKGQPPPLPAQTSQSSKDMGQTSVQTAPADKPCDENCQMRVAEIGRQATLEAARIGRTATWYATGLAVGLGLITVLVSVWYAKAQIAAAHQTTRDQITAGEKAVGDQIAAARKATDDQIAAARKATDDQIRAAQDATKAQITRQDDEHKSQVAFDLHREWSAEGMLVTRTRAGKLLSYYPGSISQLEAQGDPDEAARLWVVLNFYVRLGRIIESDQIDLKLVPDLFGDTFYWWYRRFKEKKLDKTEWESWEVISRLRTWFENRVPAPQADQWERRAAIDPNNPSRQGAISGKPGTYTSFPSFWTP